MKTMLRKKNQSAQGEYKGQMLRDQVLSLILKGDARIIMGPEFPLSDDEIEAMVKQMEKLAHIGIDTLIGGKKLDSTGGKEVSTKNG